MKEVKVCIIGISPLLMNKRPPQEIDEVKVKKNAATIDPKEDAKKKSHYEKDIGYYIPSDMIEASMREAGKSFKVGRGTAKKNVQSSVFIKEEKVPLGKQEPDAIDVRWGTHPSTGNSVSVHRSRFDSWKVNFTIQFDEERLDEKTIKSIVEEAGKVIAIGSYRPKFGRFKLESFEFIK